MFAIEQNLKLLLIFFLRYVRIIKEGMALAGFIKEKPTYTSLFFVSDDPRYAVDAFGVRALGFVLKTFKKERLREEIVYAMSNKAVTDR